jgi:hypothetical protein
MSSKFFKKGDRVRMTPEYAAKHKNNTGTVARNNRGTFVAVIPEGCKWPQDWSVDFWELVPPTEGSDGRRQSNSDTERLSQ